MESKAEPFRQFVLKTHSRCDLACDHCYIYEHADQSWLGRPRALAQSTAESVARRIAQHAAEHRLPDIHLVLHGGEPLLLGHRRTRQLLATLTGAVDPTITRLDLRIHTNGLLLDEEYCDLFSEYRVSVGVSLDGDRTSHDRHRRHRDGRGSHEQVLSALALLRRPRYRDLYAGLLCTIDLANDPIDVYRALIEQEPPRIDLLLPHATWENQPPGLNRPRSLARPRQGGSPDGHGEYGLWLNRVYDAWLANGRPVPVRVFESVLAALHGRPSQTESLGLASAAMVVIETDGSLELADTLKTAYPGAPETGFDVFRHDLDTAAAHPGFAEQNRGIEGLSPTCLACPVSAVCGAGLYAHRYAAGSGFDNPSVYCADLFGMIEHIRGTVGAHAETAVRDPAEQPGPAAHALSAEQFDELACGYGGTDTIDVLSQAQRSINRDLLAMVGSLGPAGDRSFTQSWELLTALDDGQPAAVERILMHPYTRVWAVGCLDAIRRSPGSARETAGLGFLAAAAAVRAGVAARLPLTIAGSSLPLPTLGVITLPQDRAEVVFESVGDGTVAVHAGDRTHRVAVLEPGDADSPNTPRALDGARWDAVRHVRIGGFDITLEDTDPFRDCHGRATGRLTTDEAARWAVELRGAFAFIDEHLTRYAPGLRAGLTTVMPMPSGKGAHSSAAARHAYGAVGAARADDPAVLALLLVHEFQHVKLGAVLDLYELFDTSDTAERYYAPWRPDPRPLEGLFQGTYAHVAVTDFWRIRRDTAVGPARDEAEAHFARWRAHSVEAVEQLLSCGSLTALGERFVRGIQQTVAPWLDEQVGAAALAAARQRSLEHRTAFDRLVQAGP
jgi:uncharacterized protein